MKTVLLFFLSCFSLLSFGQSKAIYNITFQSTWNSADHGTLPGSAHWSNLVGALHNSNVIFLEMGQPASPGIENVAELGSNGIFNTEVQSAIDDGNADQWLQKSVDPFAAIASATLEGIEVDENFSLLTLASMIAPSPDWMIAVNSINLRDGNNWKGLIEIDLFPYDAGTEEGFGYSGSNPASPPGGVITNIAGAPNYPFNTNKIGTLTVELQEVLNVSELSLEESFSMSPNPTDGLLHFQFNSEKPTKIEIFDILGKRILVDTNTDIEFLDLRKHNSGMYITHLYFGDRVITQKVVKN